MIVSESLNQNVKIRIHDDYCHLSSDTHLSCVNRILTESHKRRLLESNSGSAQDMVAVDGFTSPKKLT